MLTYSPVKAGRLLPKRRYLLAGIGFIGNRPGAFGIDTVLRGEGALDYAITHDAVINDVGILPTSMHRHPILG
jgi:hypothetical protein